MVARGTSKEDGKRQVQSVRSSPRGLRDAARHSRDLRFFRALRLHHSESLTGIQKDSPLQ